MHAGHSGVVLTLVWQAMQREQQGGVWERFEVHRNLFRDTEAHLGICYPVATDAFFSELVACVWQNMT
eukprot:1633260-Amphidinium_carterae.2